jgi:predicted ArsR family transcriptional regulator
MLDALSERLPADALDDLLRDVGHRLAAGLPAPTGDLRGRVERAVALLGELGGLAGVQEQDGGFVIQGCSCPLAAAVEGHPQSCQIAETLLADVIGAPVRQTCDPEIPRCRFEIGAAVGAGTMP